MFRQIQVLGNETEHSHVLIKSNNKDFLDNELSFNQFKLRGMVDTCYLDPPYNTGNTNSTGFTYHDKFGDDEWISMMRERIAPLKTLLKSTGIVVMSIDDSEVARLRLLLDDIFGKQNFIAQLTIDGGAYKNNSRFFSVTHEYMLVYANNLTQLNKSGVKWRKQRDGVEILLNKYRELKDAGNTDEQITRVLKSWVKTQPLSPRLKVFYNVESRGLYTYADLSVPGNRYEYTILHPVTGKPVQEPSRGWGLSLNRFQELQADNQIIWGDDETKQPLKKVFLKAENDQLMKSVLEYPARSSTHLLERLLGKRTSFNNPKNLQMMKDIIDYTTPTNGIVLDYFGGSGSTLHAIMELNAENYSTRRGFLVTNNENNIFDEVTLPRIQAVQNQYPTQNVVVYSDYVESN